MAIQPFFTLSSKHYYVRRVHAHGITQVYAYKPTPENAGPIIGVPDGSIDVRFDFCEGNVRADVFGPVLASGGEATQKPGHTYFGIRFEPGVLPPFLSGEFADYVSHDFDLTDCGIDTSFVRRVAAQSDLTPRTDFILKAILHFPTPEKTPDKMVLLSRIIDMITDRKGRVAIEDLASEFGYTTRTISKLFNTYLGMSPKKFCEAMRFQHSLMHLTRGNFTTITDVALDVGYYDQSQMTRDFKKNAAMTPKKFRSEVIASHYIDKFVLL